MNTTTETKTQMQHTASLLLNMKDIRDQMSWGSSERRTMDIAISYVYSDRVPAGQSVGFLDIYEEVKNHRADFAAWVTQYEED